MNSIKEFEKRLFNLDLTKIDNVTKLINDIEEQENFDIFDNGEIKLDIKLRIKKIFMIKILKTLKRLVNHHNYLLQ